MNAPVSKLPVLYSFRRCPYAMRARMALWISGVSTEMREVKLADKPAAMLEASPKGTVPVVVEQDGNVLEESLDVMRWALAQNDPEGWLDRIDDDLIATIDGPFKHHLDRYKYSTRHDSDAQEHRAASLKIITDLNDRLNSAANLSGNERGFTDAAIFPFVRQFANSDRDWFDSLPMNDLHSWLERHLSSNLFAAIMPKYKPWQPGNDVKVWGREAA